MANSDVRIAMLERGLKHYQVAEACNVHPQTFSRWLQIELKPEKKRQIMEIIYGI